MSPGDGPAGAEEAAEAPRAGRARTAARLAAALLALAAASVFVYYRLFTVFTAYDDEGYMLITIQDLLRGHALYDEIFTFYGPFYYLPRFLLHGVLGVGLTNEAIRWVVAATWIATAGLVAAAAWRMTRRGSAAALAFALTVFHLWIGVNEPAHPQDMVALMAALAGWIAASWPAGRPGRAVAALGAVAACLVLTKVNVGIFAGLALLLALMASAEGRLARWAWAALSAAAVALPFLVARKDLGTGWVLGFACSAASGLLAITIASARAPRSIPMGAARAVALFAAGFAAAAVLPVAFVLAKGTTPFGLINAILLLPMTKFRSSFAYPGPFGAWDIAWGVASVGMSAAFVVLARRPSARGALEAASAALKAALGLAILVGVVKSWGILTFNIATPMLWVFLAPAPSRDGRPVATASRTIIGVFAALQILQAYPVAGSQLYFGSVLYILIAATCLDDAVRWAEGRRGAGTIAGRAARLALPAFAAVLVVTLGYRGYRLSRGYAALTPMAQVGAPGLGRIRIPEAQVATYRWFVSNLSRFADTFQCTTGLNSLYLWTGIDPPTTIVVSHSLDIFSDEQQESIVRALRRSPNACVIAHPGFFEVGTKRPGPLVAEVARSYVTCGEVDRFEFRVRDGRPLPTLVDCVRPGAGGDGTESSLTLAPVPGRSAHRACVVDTSDGSILADTRPSGKSSPMRVEDRTSGAVLPPDAPGRAGLDLSATRDLALTLPPLPPSTEGHFLVLRLLGPDDEAVVSVPFLAPAHGARASPAP